MVRKKQFSEGPLGRSCRSLLYQERVLQVCPKIAAKWTSLAPISLYLSERREECEGFDYIRRVRTFRFAHAHSKKKIRHLLNELSALEVWKLKRNVG